MYFLFKLKEYCNTILISIFLVMFKYRLEWVVYNNKDMSILSSFDREIS